MTRFMLTAAATVLIPAVALAESHMSGDTMHKSEAPMPIDQPKGADSTVDAVDVAEDMDPTSMRPEDTRSAKANMGNNLGLNGPVAASRMIGAPIFTIAGSDDDSWDRDVSYETVSDTWARIGSVDDVILADSGRIEGIVAEVGGFLGIGDKLVRLPLDELRVMQVTDDDYAIVTPYTNERLNEMDIYESAMLR